MIRRRLRSLARAGFGGVVFAFLYLPLALVVLFAFNDSERIGLPIRGWTLDWFGALAANERLLRSIATSLQVASVATLIAVVLGTAGAFVVVRAPIPGRRLIELVVLLPLVLPGVVLGVGLLILAKAVSLHLSLWTVVAGHVALITPVVLFVVTARLRRLGPNLELAARDLGASPVQTARHVTWPLIRSAVGSGALLAFTLSFDEVTITFLLTGSENTLPVQVYSMVRFGLTPEINALYALVIGAGLLLVGLSSLRGVLSRRHGRVHG